MILVRNILSVKRWICTKIPANPYMNIEEMLQEAEHGKKGNYVEGKITPDAEPFWIALTAFSIGAALWLIGIKSISLSKAFSVTSLNFIFIALYSFLVLNEEVSIIKIISCILIIIGVLLMTVQGKEPKHNNY